MTCPEIFVTNGTELDSPNSKDHKCFFYANCFVITNIHKKCQKRRIHFDQVLSCGLFSLHFLSLSLSYLKTVYCYVSAQ